MQLVILHCLLLIKKIENGLFGNEIINPFSQIRDTYNSYFGNSIEGNFQLGI